MTLLISAKFCIALGGTTMERRISKHGQFWVFFLHRSDTSIGPLYHANFFYFDQFKGISVYRPILPFCSLYCIVLVALPLTSSSCIF